ncbi:TRAP transporter substrate-binding protein [Microvirga sp. 2YAF29]|uniref:TRAP transporter substrate-binding protein n=1 Tax=Microvirga sp. 2YAF29 TaxID=3233031 RepID=UPI003F9D8623
MSAKDKILTGYKDHSSSSPTRRRVLALGGGLMASPFLLRGASAQAFELKLTHFVPPSNNAHLALEAWAKRLSNETAGRLKISIFPSGQMGPPPRQYDLARTGAADLAFFAHGLTPGRFPLTEVAHLPSLIPGGEAGSGILMSAAHEYLQAEHQGVKILALVTSPQVQVFSARANIMSLADLKGKRIRHPGVVPAKMLVTLGASPASVPPTEMGDALDKGTIDGILTTHEAMQSFQLGTVIRNALDLNGGVATFALVMNQASYDRLPEDIRKAIDAASGLGLSKAIGASYEAAESNARAYMAQNKVTMTSLAGESKKAFQDAIEPMIQASLKETEAKGLPANALFGALKKAASGT